MTGTEILYQYMLNKEIFLMNDIIQLDRNVTYIEADNLDHLEMIISNVRLATAQEIFKDIRFLIRTYF